VSEIRRVNGKPLLRAGKLASADACCSQCNCDMDEFNASGLTPSVTIKYTVPAYPPCGCAGLPFMGPQNCQCPAGDYQASFALENIGSSYNSACLNGWSKRENVTVAGITVSVYAELCCFDCQFVLSVALFSFPANSSGDSWNCLFGQRNACIAILGNQFCYCLPDGFVSAGIKFFALQSRRVDGVCLPLDMSESWSDAVTDVSGEISFTVV
jgi:hypothetical protein